MPPVERERAADRASRLDPLPAAERWAAGDGALGLAVFAAAVPLLMYGLGWGLGVDVALVGGDRMLRGDMPYRDFWTLYAPGSSAAVAAVFWLLGRELIAVHAVAALTSAAACAAFFGLLRAAGLARVPSLTASGVFALAVWTPAPTLAWAE